VHDDKDAAKRTPKLDWELLELPATPNAFGGGLVRWTPVWRILEGAQPIPIDIGELYEWG
jgi:hypothetical protein